MRRVGRFGPSAGAVEEEQADGEDGAEEDDDEAGQPEVEGDAVLGVVDTLGERLGGRRQLVDRRAEGDEVVAEGGHRRPELGQRRVDRRQLCRRLLQLGAERAQVVGNRRQAVGDLAQVLGRRLACRRG